MIYSPLLFFFFFFLLFTKGNSYPRLVKNLYCCAQNKTKTKKLNCCRITGAKDALQDQAKGMKLCRAAAKLNSSLIPIRRKEGDAPPTSPHKRRGPPYPPPPPPHKGRGPPPPLLNKTKQQQHRKQRRQTNSNAPITVRVDKSPSHSN